MATVADLTAGTRLLFSLPSFLRSPIQPEHARALLRVRLHRRGEDFLDLMRRTVFEPAASPYRRLLSHAGCEYGDLATLVRGDGVEGALHALYRNGVYLTADEFKGRRPVVRGSLTLTVHPAQFANPLATVHVPTQSSGSRGERTSAGIDLAHLRDQAVGLRLFLDARGARRWVHAHCGVPGGSALHAMLRLSYAGCRRKPGSRTWTRRRPTSTRGTAGACASCGGGAGSGVGRSATRGMCGPTIRARSSSGSRRSAAAAWCRTCGRRRAPWS